MTTTNFTAARVASIARRPYIQPDDWRKAAKAYADAHGHFGRVGGWIYNAAGNSIAHGWSEYAAMHRQRIRDYMTRELTAFGSFREMVAETHSTYRPTIIPRTWRERFLADAYDVAQDQRGDPRRAWRGIGSGT